MISKVFIDRPVLASVISLIILIAGAIALIVLPVQQYPDITPTVVSVGASFPGASAEVVRQSVATPLEQELNGTPNMISMEANCSSAGGMSMVIMFDPKADPDIAAVDVQNRVKLAESRLPAVVVEQGITVEKTAAFLLMILAVHSEDERYDYAYLSNFTTISVLDFLKRVPGVGKVSNMASRYYAMRLWVYPERLAILGLTVDDLRNAIMEQNAEASVGTLGEEPIEGQQFILPLIAKGRLSDPKEFEQIIVRTNPDGSLVRVVDVARVELGSSGYAKATLFDGSTGVALGIYLLPGANAIQVAGEIRQAMAEISQDFPKGIEYTVAFDNAHFVNASIKKILITFAIAFGVVLVVIALMLQSGRSAAIAALAIPVPLVGAFAFFNVFGLSINTFSLLALVIAVGFVADDLIVVIGRTRQVMADSGLGPREATVKAMTELAGTLVTTGLVLAGVFIAIGFAGGIPGRLFREFLTALAIVVILSSVVALTLGPALCALFQKQSKGGAGEGPLERLLQGGGRLCMGLVGFLLNHVVLAIGLFLALSVGAFFLFRAVPTGFLPEEDQGYILAEFQLPDGATFERTSGVMDRAQGFFLDHPAVEHVLSLKGTSVRVGETGSRGHFLIILKPWKERQTPELSNQGVIQAARRELARYPEALVFLFNPPTIPGLGSGGGFVMKLQDRTGRNYEGLVEAAQTLIEQGNMRPELQDMASNMQPGIPQFSLDVDRERAKLLGVRLQDIYSTVSSLLSGRYVNDFNMFNRVYKVYIQAEEAYRRRPSDIGRFYVRSDSGVMVPVSALATGTLTSGPGAKRRFNMFDAVTLLGQPAPGYSSGEAIAAMEEMTAQILPPGIGYQWSDVTLEEIKAASQTLPVLILALVLTFLLLAALYESWALPMAVLLTVPLAVLGALAAVLVGSLQIDIYFQIALMAVIGLSWKHAIQTVALAKIKRQEGATAKAAGLEAARQRFRPVLTSALAFLVGMLPLLLTSGAASASRQVVGTTVIGGMLAAGILGFILIPSLFAVAASLTKGPRGARREDRAQSEGEV
jgi:hydrophobe/amphiphile efflux-1 (HAE1) family protein